MSPRGIRAPRLIGSRQAPSTPIRSCCVPAPSTSHFQHHSANNVAQSSSAASVGPRRATPGAMSTGGESPGSGTGTAVDSRRPQSPLQDNRYHHDKPVSAGAVAGWGRQRGSVEPVLVATSSCIQRSGREELESKDDGTPMESDLGQSGASNVAACSPSFSESWTGRASGPSQQRCFSSGTAHQNAMSGSRQDPVGGKVSENCVPEAAGPVPAAPQATRVASRQASARSMARGAIDEVGWPGTLLLRTPGR